MIGLLAAFLSTVSFVPQAIQVIKTKDTKSISLGMYSIFTTGVLMWLIYGIQIGDVPMILANMITFVLAATILTFKIIYK